MSDAFDADVIIIGGGPVGLSAAMDLDARGVTSIVIERRAYLEAPSVKCNHVSARTMERFRQLGIAGKVRAAGLPADHPQDIAFRTTMTGEEFARIPIPAARDRYTSTDGPDTRWATPEPPHRINQTFLEPILQEHAAALPRVEVRFGTDAQGFAQDEDGVTVTIAPVGGGAAQTVRARFLIGADGGKSAVRKAIGAKLSGDPVLQHVQSTCIRSPRLGELLAGRRSWGTYTFNPRRNGHVYAIDGREVFLLHNHLTTAEFEAGNVDRGAAIRAILGVDADFPYEIVSEEDWVARRLVADTFRDRRVFLAGDASHLWVPYAGYGMNAGIADVLNLTWALGAHLSGWADAGILDAYEAERLPITEQVSRFAMGHQRKIVAADVPAEIEDDSEAGRAARERLGRDAYELNVQQFAAEGLNFGYSYDASPVIAYDDATPPAYTMGSYTPSTVPGCRAPHFWLDEVTSLYDVLARGYTLLRFGDADGIAPLLSAATDAGLPLEVLPLPRELAPAEYEHRYLIVRDDQHVVWRGDAAPADPAALVALLRGAAAIPASTPAAPAPEAAFAP